MTQGCHICPFPGDVGHLKSSDCDFLQPCVCAVYCTGKINREKEIENLRKAERYCL